MTSPRVSVILPLYNGADQVGEAIQSILSQTFVDFELIVINDGSKDDSSAVVRSFSDPRLRLIEQENRGLAATLNLGIEMARGEFIARQDHDDLSMPDRLEKQVAFLSTHPDHALLGTRSRIHVNNTPTERGHDHPLDDMNIRFELLFDSQFVHSSVMLRRDAVRAIGGYTTDPQRQPPEDFELWSRLARRHRMANLPDRLVIYREMPTSISRTVSFQDKVALISAENLAATLGLSQPSQEMHDAASLLLRSSTRLSRHPNYQLMTSIIRRAAERIAQGRQDEEFTSRLRYRLASLRYHYMNYRHPYLRTALSAARPLAQRLINLIR